MNSMNRIETICQLDQLRYEYAELIVEGMDMKSLITFAVESIEHNLRNYDMSDLKDEVIECYGEETWAHLVIEHNSNG